VLTITTLLVRSVRFYLLPQVNVAIYAEGNLGEFFSGVSVALLFDKRVTKSRIDTFFERAGTCMEVYGAEFLQHKAYRMWIASEIEESTEYNDFMEWFDYDDAHISKFPLVVCGAYWPRWQLWLQVARTFCLNDSRWLSFVGNANADANRPDFAQPHVLHADGTTEALQKDTLIGEETLIGYPYANTPEYRAAAFALRIKQSSSDAPAHFRRFSWSKISLGQVDTRDIDVTLEARVVPNAYEKIDTWMTWSEGDESFALRLIQLSHSCTGNPSNYNHSKFNSDMDPRQAKDVAIGNWDCCYAVYTTCETLPILFLEFLGSETAFDAWYALRNSAETTR
jgi:hypothetical protein